MKLYRIMLVFLAVTGFASCGNDAITFEVTNHLDKPLESVYMTPLHHASRTYQYIAPNQTDEIEIDKALPNKDGKYRLYYTIPPDDYRVFVIDFKKDKNMENGARIEIRSDSVIARPLD